MFFYGWKQMHTYFQCDCYLRVLSFQKSFSLWGTQCKKEQTEKQASSSYIDDSVVPYDHSADLSTALGCVVSCFESNGFPLES